MGGGGNNGEGGWVGVSRANPRHERVAFPGLDHVLFLLSVLKGWKMTGRYCDCLVHSPTPWCRGGSGLGGGSGGG